MTASPADLVTGTAPAQCALALALPLDRGAFLADLEAGTGKDFAAGMLHGGQPERAWATVGAPLAELCRELLRLAEELGIGVARQARLGDLPALFRAHSVVTIVAHWRGALVVGADLLDEPAVLLNRIEAGAGPLHRELATRLPPNAAAPALGRPTPARRCAAFAQLLNDAVIRSAKPLPGCVALTPEGVTAVVDDLTLESLHRDRLDQLFPDLLRPGNRLELRDGLHPPASIAAAVPPGWTGIVDFAVCRSAYLAHSVKGGRPERRIVTNVHEVVPDVRLRIQKELYRRLAAAERNYARELMEIFHELAVRGLPPRRGILDRLVRHSEGSQPP